MLPTPDRIGREGNGNGWFVFVGAKFVFVPDGRPPPNYAKEAKQKLKIAVGRPFWRPEDDEVLMALGLGKEKEEYAVNVD